MGKTLPAEADDARLGGPDERIGRTRQVQATTKASTTPFAYLTNKVEYLRYDTALAAG